MVCEHTYQSHDLASYENLNGHYITLLQYNPGVFLEAGTHRFLPTTFVALGCKIL